MNTHDAPETERAEVMERAALQYAARVEHLEAALTKIHNEAKRDLAYYRERGEHPPRAVFQRVQALASRGLSREEP